MSSKGKYLFLILGLFLVIYSTFMTINFKKIEKMLDEENNNYLSIHEELEMTKEYTDCILEGYSEEDNTLMISNKIEELNDYFKSNYGYRISVYYEDTNTGFSYGYRENEIYYGASLIKLLEAMYIYDEAILGSININDEMIYTSKYKNDYSIGMDEYRYGDKVSFKKLADYVVRYSDNTAHAMLYGYIGRDKLIRYGESIGAKYTLQGDDTYGSQTVMDTNMYLRHAYKLIGNGTEYGKMLEESMMNTLYNSLYLTLEEENNVAHKYGWYGSNYHDIGIVFEDGAVYNISVLTTYGEEDYEDIVRDIHKRVNELHNEFYNMRKNECKNN